MKRFLTVLLSFLLVFSFLPPFSITADTDVSGTTDPKPLPGDNHSHKFDQMAEKPEALKTAGDCQNNAVYFYSCTCGRVGTYKTWEKENSTVHSEAFSHSVANDYITPTVDIYECELCGVETRRESGFALCDFNRDGVVEAEDYSVFDPESADLEIFDFNQSGIIDSFDLTVIKNLTNKIKLEEITDINGDNTSNLRDVARAKKIWAGYSLEGDLDRDLDGHVNAEDIVFMVDFALFLQFGNSKNP